MARIRKGAAEEENKKKEEEEEGKKVWKRRLCACVCKRVGEEGVKRGRRGVGIGERYGVGRERSNGDNSGFSVFIYGGSGGGGGGSGRSVWDGVDRDEEGLDQE